MANYYTDHPEYDFYLNHPEMKRVVELKERNFADKDKYEDAPVDFDDAIENYKRVLDITGDIAANIIEPNAEDVDLEGPHLVDVVCTTPQRPTKTLRPPARQACGASLCLAATMV